MRHLLLGFLALILTGCATAAPSLPDAGTGPPAPDAPAPAAPESPEAAAVAALARHPLLHLAVKDADATLAWVEAHRATLGPLKAFRASQCPTAVKLAVADLLEKVLALKQRLHAMRQRLTDGPTTPEVILALTKLKYGDPVDPQAAIGQLRDDIAMRLGAVTPSCAGLLPVEQLADLARLAGRAGLLTTPLAPLSGILP